MNLEPLRDALAPDKPKRKTRCDKKEPLVLKGETLTRVLADEAMREKFWSNVQKAGPDECWGWTGYNNGSGRGKFLIAPNTRIYAYRLALMLSGKLPDEERNVACHRCDNPGCVNPNHLWWGTFSENTLDASAKKRLHHVAKQYCAKGHPLFGDNLYVTPKNLRKCRTCRREWNRLGYIKKQKTPEYQQSLLERGVSFVTKRNKWKAELRVPGKRYHIGEYNTREEALLAYQEASIRIRGDLYDNRYGRSQRRDYKNEVDN